MCTHVQVSVYRELCVHACLGAGELTGSGGSHAEEAAHEVHEGCSRERGAPPDKVCVRVCMCMLWAFVVPVCRLNFGSKGVCLNAKLDVGGFHVCLCAKS